jgi:hypothetical protein
MPNMYEFKRGKKLSQRLMSLLNYKMRKHPLLLSKYTEEKKKKKKEASSNTNIIKPQPHRHVEKLDPAKRTKKKKS